MTTSQAGKDRDKAIDEAARAVVLRDANRREEAEAEEHFRKPQLIGDEHFDFADARDLASDIAALVRREVERAVAQEREAVRHKPMPGSKERFGNVLCAKCGVVIPEPETCCRNELAAIRARSKEGA